MYHLGDGSFTYIQIESGEDIDNVCNERDYEGIPLTTEILTKFGALHIQDDKWFIALYLFKWYGNGIKLAEEGLPNEEYNSRIFYRHVHELQNLIYWLKGYELELNEEL